MELREWLIILGLALVTIIVIDGVRRLQRQRRVPRLDQVDNDTTSSSKGEVADPEQAAREAEINWELPNGGARVVKPASYQKVESKPKLQRQEHPGPSKVLASWRHQGQEEASDDVASPGHSQSQPSPATASGKSRVKASHAESDARRSTSTMPPAEEAHDERPAAASAEPVSKAESSESAPEAGESRHTERSEPTLSALTDDEPTQREANAEVAGLSADPEDHDDYHDAERYRLVDLDGMTDSLKSGSVKMGASMQRFGASLQKNLAERKAQRKKDKLKREQEKAERKAREASRRQQEKAEREAREAEKLQREKERSMVEDDYDDPLFTPPRRPATDSVATDREYREEIPTEAVEAGEEDVLQEGVVTPHPVVERVLRHDVSAEHARDTLSHAEEVIVISVMSRDEEGFSGAALLDLMMACGLRYSSEMGIFHRFETEDLLSELQFSMVNVLKPGTFPLETMDDFTTPGITLLMPLPGASDTAAAFEAMVETAMVVVRHLGGELKDENRSVMTAQTVEFARQRVQEFERRHRLHRYQAN
ncbi:hypothetical protein L861_23615 [Litchfieldella anticariensis FP35 = DSM 16096]|uniref:Cell division protein ZipA n=1 Tax=Litchfieldella anticariensis (strain DSM 16096 / CECT 5854 / CIP 108499 / LMG 22089 / FP35) TaxID=1121939 RepID=S2KLJ9_LITA3|nr:cell division protein ZipA [Halomonas anticariensis]EPC02805.1 hypothetical protein L861_23615 [Halomonas anticariensis FP35 = DSM 16096]